ncbi:CDP-glycerol glycerophosphotransferase family protein [Succinimonas amylolytica]|uniref:CDP-glycerol glycerophosphotransferase family protein n=1 Tax=Succinimonas amylolytica TaxID=83769 RepID=UPI00036BEB74|nr:CDP-glycerol glycerophosphotransferase family protein [Succinimonas amylolytica]
MFNLFSSFDVKNKSKEEVKNKADAEAKKKAEVKAISTIVKYMNFTDSASTENDSSDEYVFSSSNNVLKRIFNLCCSEEDVKRFGIVVFCYGRYRSINIFSALKKYAKSGLPIVLVINYKSTYDDNFLSEIKSIEQWSNVSVIQAKRSVHLVTLLISAFKLLKTEFVEIFTAYDILNPRSFENNSLSLINSQDQKLFFLPISVLSSWYFENNTFFDEMFDIVQEFNNGSIHSRIISKFNEKLLLSLWDLSYISGVIVNTQKMLPLLTSMKNENDAWFPLKLFSLLPSDSIVVSDMSSLFSHRDPIDITVTDIAVIGREIIFELSENQYELSKVNVCLDKLLLSIKDIYINFKLNYVKKATLIAVSAYIIYQCELNHIKMEDWKERFNQVFDFGLILKQTAISKLLNDFVDMFIDKSSSNIDLFIVENFGMSDIKDSKFYQLAKEEFTIDYLLKRSNFDYYDFNNLIIKMHSKAAKLTISSGSLNRNMLSGGDRHLTLWHGLGWLKKTVVKPDKFTVGNIVCSSVTCAPLYKEHFYASDSIGLGSVQTDYLFDEEYRTSNRLKIRQKYNIPLNAGLIFFAPTFRLSDFDGLSYYNFGMDIDFFAEELEKSNLYLITKRHHVFSSILADRGIDTSGVKNSNNGHFIVDDFFNFSELVCACDSFLTDYSSGLYYALAIKKPIFLYAIDVNDYMKGKNGFEISYPDDIPVPFVGVPDPSKIIEGYFLSIKNVTSMQYLKYMDESVGSCDGNVGNKVIQYIKNTYLCGA